MEKAFRIYRNTIPAPLSGIGASQYPGRWNLKGTKVNYLAESLALATLEILVNLNDVDTMETFNYIEVSFPKNLILDIPEDEISPDWRQPVRNRSSQEFGDRFLRQNPNRVIKIPSVVIPSGFNYLLPATLVEKTTQKGPFPYPIDPRLLKDKDIKKTR